MSAFGGANRRAVPKVVQKSRVESGEYVFGLDRELKEKERAKHDPQLEAQAIAFIEELAGRALEGDMMDALKDGILLCEAINAIKPKAVRRINKSRLPFKQMENVSNFIKACRALGVPEYALFTTPDLYDGKSRNNVVNGIVALGSKAQTLPGYSGPLRKHEGNNQWTVA